MSTYFRHTQTIHYQISIMKVGLTGGIGSGKTTVAKIFETLDIPVYYADDEAKHLMEEDITIQQAIIQNFGKESYTKDGKLNRTHLSSIVFNDPEKLKRLNAITHPAVIQHATQWMQQQQSPYVIKEAALIFESGAQSDLDYIIGVYAPESLRIHRVMQRDHIDRNKVLHKIQNQIDENIKMRLCNKVIKNDDQTSLIHQVLLIHEHLLGMTNK